MKNGVVVGGWIEMRLFVATVFWGLMMKEIKNHMKFLDLFAGIGGFRLGMESAGHECIGFCEIDKFARASYKAIHDTKGEIELHDITAVSDESIRRIGRVDIICGGFPDWAFDKAQEVNSNSQLYKQAGNSVIVSVIAAIAKELEILIE